MHYVAFLFKLWSVSHYAEHNEPDSWYSLMAFDILNFKEDVKLTSLMSTRNIPNTIDIEIRLATAERCHICNIETLN
jgi:hypothetical protein